MIFIDEVKYFIGSQYREGLQVVPILLWANICLGIYYNLTIWYKLTNQTIMGTYITLGGAAITLFLNFMLIPKIGYVGSAWATLACYAAMMAASYFLGQKYYPINYPLKNIFKQFSLLLILYSMATVLVKSTYFHFGILVSLMGIAIFAIWKMNRQLIHQ